MKELKTAAVILSIFTLFTIIACGAKAKTAQTAIKQILSHIFFPAKCHRINWL